MESNNIDNAICLNIKTGVYKRVKTMVSGPDGSTIMFQDGEAIPFSEFSSDWIVDSEMTDEEFKEVSELNVFNINNNYSVNAEAQEFDNDLLSKPLNRKKTRNNVIKKPVAENLKNEDISTKAQEFVSDSTPIQKTPVNSTITDLFSRLPDNVTVNVDGFVLNNFPVSFIRDFIKYFNINKDDLADGLLNKYKAQFKSLIIDYVCKENKD
jgi:hypothetical protein